MSVLTGIYFLFFMVSAGLVLSGQTPLLVPWLLYGMLGTLVAMIPLHLAWTGRRYGSLFLQAAFTITYSVIAYGLLFKSNAVVPVGYAQPMILTDSIYFSASVWTGTVNGEYVLGSSAKALVVFEALNAYVAMAVLIAVIVLWVEDTLNNSENYLATLKSKRRKPKVK